MKVAVVRTETQVTTWRGRLTRDELDALLIDTLRDKLGAQRYGLILQIDLGPVRDHEARSILNGLATEQGNTDNRIFGTGQPEAAIAMILHSKAIADTFVTGRAFLADFMEMAGD